MTDTPQSESSQASSVPVVAIGASAGGLEQIKWLLSHLPAHTGAAFVIMQHLDPEHESQLPELLARACELPVVAIDEQMTAVADQVHVLAPGQRLDMNSDRVLHASTGMARESTPTLIDHFFRSLAAALGRHAVGIVLSGIGSDGALGLKAIRSAGGLAIAQRPDNAEYDGMPRAAAKYASPDCLLDTADMVTPLCNHLRLTLRHRAPEAADTTSEDNPSDEQNVTGSADIDDQTLSEILELLRERGSYDFRHHKTSMLKRRLQRRMALNCVNNSQMYVRTLRQDETERTRLCSDFLISVTDFFREPKSYEKLTRTVIRPLLHGRSVTAPIRVWVPGCATGEEAYTIAMLLAEAIELSGRDYKFIIFATDIDETALAHARAGVYPDSIEVDVSGDRLGRFFDKVDSHYQIKRSIREQVVFAPQSVTDDPPYSHLDLISCRNLLIYLNSDTQKRLITLFHFALQDSGFLFLGSSQTVGNQIDLFEPLSKEHRIYRRLATNRQYRVDFPTPHSVRNNRSGHAVANNEGHTPRARDIEHMQQLQLLADAVPQLIAFLDGQQMIRFANTALLDWFERRSDQLVGHNIADVLAADVMATLAPNINTALQGKASSCDLNLAHDTAGERRFQASLLPHVVDGDTLGLYVVMADTTGCPSVLDSEEEAARLTYIQRMATIGEMASTLAHDLNQPLSAINSYAGALTHMLHAGKPAQETTPILTKMANQVERAHHIISDVRGFVGRRDDGHEAVDLNELLRKVVDLTSGRARKMHVETQMSEYRPLPTTNGNAVQLQQVLINLINNAIDAMENTAEDQRWLQLHTEVPDAGHVHVVIRDAGPGIAANKLDSIFNSFQSTKLDGMGMGLAISRAIVRWHGGRLWAESQNGHGATFYLSLPVAD